MGSIAEIVTASISAGCFWYSPSHRNSFFTQDILQIHKGKQIVKQVLPGFDSNEIVP